MSQLQFINQSHSFTQEKIKNKRVKNCFIAFRNEMLKIVRENNVGNMPMKELSKIVSGLWKNLSESEKNKYRREYEVNREISKTPKSMLIQEIVDLFNRLLHDSSNILNLKIIIMSKVEEYIDNVCQFEEKSPESILQVYYYIYSSINNNSISFNEFVEWYLEL